MIEAFARRRENISVPELYSQSKFLAWQPVWQISVEWMQVGFTCAVCLALAATSTTARGASAERTSVIVLVKDAETDQPINQARLTLRFREPRRFGRSKWLSFSAKTNAQGRYRFTLIPKGTVQLTVTAEHHQTFSKEFDVDKDNEALEVKLKPPQPLL
jgi:Carboxypeptidase regulatory-like domain